MAVILNDADPCGTAAALKQVLSYLATGSVAQSVTFKGGPNGSERSVTYNKAELGALRDLIRDYEGQCAALTGGGRPRRFAMRAGGRV